MYIMHSKVIFSQMSTVVSACYGQRRRIDVEGYKARSGKIIYNLVTRYFVGHNWEVGFFFSEGCSGNQSVFGRSFQNNFTYRFSFDPHSKTGIHRSTLTISETNTQGS